MRTQVAIIGAGPAGVLLSELLDRQGVTSVVLEAAEPQLRAGAHPRAACSSQLRCEVLRAKRPSRAHGPGGPRPRRHKDRLGRPRKLLPRHPEAYRQAFRGVRTDQPAGRICSPPPTAAARRSFAEAAEVQPRDFDTESAVGELFAQWRKAPPGLRFRRRVRRIPRRVAQERCRRGAARVREGLSLRLARDPFGKTPPLPDITYCNHARGFALASMRNPQLSALLHPGAATARIWRSWPDERFWQEIKARFPRELARAHRHRARRSRNRSRRCAATSPSRCSTGGSSSPGTPRTSFRRPAPRA